MGNLLEQSKEVVFFLVGGVVFCLFVFFQVHQSFFAQLLSIPDDLEVPCLVLTGVDKENSNPFKVNRGLVPADTQKNGGLSLNEETDRYFLITNPGPGVCVCHSR